VRLSDGWLASAYNTTPDAFAAGLEALREQLVRHGRGADGFPNALATMWTWITDDDSEAESVLSRVLAPTLNREVDELRERVCVGSIHHCVELLSRYARAGCERVHFWPLADEPRQIELIATDLLPQV
jgi:alkanesulfonate monooxygenase SsuD/methylene tetrahydromethanopterin reductase-like flavin-dependent oxidoreductase (luciferase family)